MVCKNSSLNQSWGRERTKKGLRYLLIFISSTTFWTCSRSNWFSCLTFRIACFSCSLVFFSAESSAWRSVGRDLLNYNHLCVRQFFLEIARCYLMNFYRAQCWSIFSSVKCFYYEVFLPWSRSFFVLWSWSCWAINVASSFLWLFSSSDICVSNPSNSLFMSCKYYTKIKTNSTCIACIVRTPAP